MVLRACQCPVDLDGGLKVQEKGWEVLSKNWNQEIGVGLSPQSPFLAFDGILVFSRFPVATLENRKSRAAHGGVGAPSAGHRRNANPSALTPPLPWTMARDTKAAHLVFGI